MRKLIMLVGLVSLLFVSFAFANPDGVVIGEGDLRIINGGSLVFSDGSVQSKAQVQGPQGLPGPANTLAIGTVATGTPGAAAAAEFTGTAPAQILNLTIPQGQPGPQGLPGPANTLTIGTVATGAPGAAAAVITGTAPAQTLNLTIPQGQPGPSGGGVPDIQVFSTDGTFIVPANVTKIMVEIWGGGGGGNNSICGNNTVFPPNPGHCGGGGGSGGYAWNVYDVTPGDAYPFTVGKGGVPNSDGGATVFNVLKRTVDNFSGALMTAGGGAHGKYSFIEVGGTGGTSTGGILSLTGFAGRTAISNTYSGEGAPSYRGGAGGIAGIAWTDSSLSTGGNGQAPGSGGGGAANFFVGTEATCFTSQGGTGADGLVVIYY